ncbi:MAG: class I SAM-dependent methyltransferase [Acidobacteria bacterium]|nr:class I SAM-dependent methyltransferase [Acidobacteriota bacterium]
MTETAVFLLDGPGYAEIRPGGRAAFRGIALAAGDDPVVEVVASSAGRTLGRAPANGPSPEISWVPLEGSAACRFTLDVPVPQGAAVDLSVRHASGAETTAFRYDVPFAEREAERLRMLAARIEAMPVPASDLVAVTQGGGDVEVYRRSILESFLAMELQLRAAGADPAGVRSVLDIGCGTGRLLAGWHVDDPGRRLVGTDLNPDLIAWARTHLPAVAAWEVNGLHPPLPHPDGAVDLVVLSSVLTHVSLANQRAWLAEVRRLLAPGGRALVTLHGTVYASVFLRGADAARWAATGYAEVAGAAEGANAYTSFHSESFARALFAEFSSAAFFPRGAADGAPRRFPVASLQDVYVLAR